MAPVKAIAFSVYGPFLEILPSEALPAKSNGTTAYLAPSTVPLVLSSSGLDLSEDSTMEPLFSPFSESVLLTTEVSSRFSRDTSTVTSETVSFFRPTIVEGLSTSFTFTPVYSDMIVVFLQLFGEWGFYSSFISIGCFVGVFKV